MMCDDQLRSTLRNPRRPHSGTASSKIGTQYRNINQGTFGMGVSVVAGSVIRCKRTCKVTTGTDLARFEFHNQPHESGSGHAQKVKSDEGARCSSRQEGSSWGKYNYIREVIGVEKAVRTGKKSTDSIVQARSKNIQGS